MIGYPLLRMAFALNSHIFIGATLLDYNSIQQLANQNYSNHWFLFQIGNERIQFRIKLVAINLIQLIFIIDKLMFHAEGSASTHRSLSKLQNSKKLVNSKLAIKKQKTEKVFAQISKLRLALGFLKENVKGIEVFKREILNEVAGMTFEYDRYINDLKIRLQEKQQLIDHITKTYQAKQEKAIQMLNQKIHQIQTLKTQLKQSNSIFEALKNSKKVQQQSIAKIRSSYQDEIGQLNVKINDLLVILHEKTHKIQQFEYETKKSSARAPLVAISEQNMANIANGFQSVRKITEQSNQKRKFIDLSRSHSKKQSTARKPLEINPCDLTEFTSKNDTIPSHRQRNSSDNEIITKLQKFVNDLTSARNYDSFTESSNIEKINIREQSKFTPKYEWSQTLRSQNRTRRNSLNFIFKK